MIPAAATLEAPFVPDAPAALLDRIDPRLRLVAAMVFAAMTVASSHLLTLVAALALAFLLALAARLPPFVTVRRMIALDGFMAMTLAMLPFSVEGHVALTVGPFAASMEGLEQAAAILLRANAVVLALLALAGALEPAILGRALAGLKVSGKFVHLFLFTLRYIELLGREYARARKAMKARAFVMGCNRHSWRMIGYLFGMMLVRSLERSERVLAAMRCRGFDGRFRSSHEERRLGMADALFAGLFVLAWGLVLGVAP